LEVTLADIRRKNTFLGEDWLFLFGFDLSAYQNMHVSVTESIHPYPSNLPSFVASVYFLC